MNDFRRWIRLCEVDINLLNRLERIAQQCDSVEQFIRKTDGEDVLYRGHHDDRTDNNSFMTDYVGHAGEYAGGEGGGGRVDAFGFDPNDVLYYDDNRFNEMRDAYKELPDKQFAALYQAALVGNRHAGSFDGRQVLAKVKKVLRGNVPYSKISGDARINDLLVPLLQKYARDTHGKNIIAFHGSDYADFGGQTEYVVGDISKLADLRKFYAKVHSR